MRRLVVMAAVERGPYRGCVAISGRVTPECHRRRDRAVVSPERVWASFSSKVGPHPAYGVGKTCATFLRHKGGDMAKSKPLYGRGTGKVHPVDVHVGARVRQLRTLGGMNQTKLGEALGMSYQQVQKYERAMNRISASRLYGLSQMFGVTVEFFFEDMPPDVAGISPANGRGMANKTPSYEPDPMTTQETMRLVRAYYSIEDAGIRTRLREMIAVLGANAGKDS